MNSSPRWYIFDSEEALLDEAGDEIVEADVGKIIISLRSLEESASWLRWRGDEDEM